MHTSTTRKILPFVLLIPLFTTHCHRAQSDAFRQTELTKEDIIYLYKVKVDETPFTKIEWNFPKPTYVRMVIERKLPIETTWTNFDVFSRPFSCKTFILFYNLKWEPAHVTGNKFSRWLLRTTYKLVGDNFSMSSGADFICPLSDTSHTGESQIPPSPRPDWIVSFGNSSMQQYRLRLEQSDQPFPEHGF